MNKYQEQILKRGTRMATDTELLAAILSEGVQTKKLESAAILANILFERSGKSIFNLSRFSVEDFKNYGLNDRQTVLVATSLEFSRRFEDRIESHKEIRFDNPQKVFDYFKSKFRDLDYEECWIVSLGSNNVLIRADKITSGIANSSQFHPRDFLRAAVRANAVSFMMVHNHPSGDSSPSREDVKITKKMLEAAKIVEINFVDHVIVGRENIPPNFQGYYSFHDAGHI
ncbi:MAG: DNA repair protein RadC [Opitutales bacterium]|nr:DNA repair protein RadC [Opitutales bacterium]